MRGIKVKLTDFDLTLVGPTKTSTANVVTSNAIDIPVIPVVNDQPLVITVGADKPLTIGPAARL